MLKRVLDIVFSLFILVLSLPLLLLAPILIKLSSPGPIIFKQKRVGQDGKIFYLLKLRTMREAKGPSITSSQDERITKIGRFLRRTKIDELPQFINVIKGDIGVVGPRPEIPEVVKTYDDEQRRILSFKPGITSLASVGFRSEEEMLGSDKVLEDYIKQILPLKIRSDLEYFKNRNFWSDLTIIVKTIRSIFDVKN